MSIISTFSFPLFLMTGNTLVYNIHFFVSSVILYRGIHRSIISTSSFSVFLTTLKYIGVYSIHFFVFSVSYDAEIHRSI